MYLDQGTTDGCKACTSQAHLDGPGDGTLDGTQVLLDVPVLHPGESSVAGSDVPLRFWMCQMVLLLGITGSTACTDGGHGLMVIPGSRWTCRIIRMVLTRY